MKALTPDQIETLKTKLQTLRAELDVALAETLAGTRPVDLEEPIGRLSRMDAMQQQSMAAANRRNLDIRQQQVKAALNAITNDEYGWCRRCDEVIDFSRLAVRPESPLCIACQQAHERRGR
jgi:DnaK suppressor protein